ncbi:MAG: hypothetical protein RIT45_4194, partial [Pseudomonadota bacterium]
MRTPDHPTPCADPSRSRPLHHAVLAAWLVVVAAAAACSSEDTIVPGPADVDASALDVPVDIAVTDADIGPGEPPDCPIGYRAFPPDAGAAAKCVVDGGMQCAPCSSDADCLGG